jgi:hypothetical protein
MVCTKADPADDHLFRPWGHRMAATMSNPLVAALVRGAIGAVVTAGAVFFTTWAQGQPLKVAGISAGAAAFSYLVVRFGAEGVIDTQAASKA